MDFYTVVLRESRAYWVALCLENGLVGQGNTKESAIEKLKEAIGSFDDVYKEEKDACTAPLSIRELHEFLSVEGKESAVESYELRAVYA